MPAPYYTSGTENGVGITSGYIFTSKNMIENWSIKPRICRMNLIIYIICTHVMCKHQDIRIICTKQIRIKYFT